jgi:hypothetical protein
MSKERMEVIQELSKKAGEESKRGNAAKYQAYCDALATLYRMWSK